MEPILTATPIGPWMQMLTPTARHVATTNAGTVTPAASGQRDARGQGWGHCVLPHGLGPRSTADFQIETTQRCRGYSAINSCDQDISPDCKRQTRRGGDPPRGNQKLFSQSMAFAFARNHRTLRGARWTYKSASKDFEKHTVYSLQNRGRGLRPLHPAAFKSNSRILAPSHWYSRAGRRQPMLACLPMRHGQGQCGQCFSEAVDPLWRILRGVQAPRGSVNRVPVRSNRRH